MLLDTLISEFIRQHYFESIYEVENRRGDSYAEIAVDTQDEYFYCSFCVLDAKRQVFTVTSERSTSKSFAYRLDKHNRLIDVKRDLFPAREILSHIANNLEVLQEIDEFLSDPYNVGLFYENLNFCKGKYGNEWTIELDSMFDEPRMDDVFRAASSVGMLWDSVEYRFTMHNAHEQIGQSTIDCAHGVVSINNYILFMVLNPGTRFNLVRYIPEKNSRDSIVYEGEIDIPNISGEGSERVYCTFTVNNLGQLPTTNIMVRVNDEEVTGKTPLLILHHPDNGILHSTLKLQGKNESIDEMIEMVNEYIPRKFAQAYIENLHQVCQLWGASVKTV